MENLYLKIFESRILDIIFMKKNNLWTLLSLLFLSVAMFSCSENNGFDDGDDNNNSSNSDNKLGEGQLELRGFSDSKIYGTLVNGTLSFYAAADKITIDWGDGSKINEITPNGVLQRLYHEYANQNFQTALINTKNLTVLGLSARSSEGYWKEVRIGSCLDLQKIDINRNHKITLLTD